MELKDTFSRARQARPYRSTRYALWKLSFVGVPRGPRITRYTIYNRLKAVKLPVHQGRILAISKSANVAELLKLEPTETVEARYPNTTVLALPFEDGIFDVVLSDQVLEHIKGNPQTAIDECHRVLGPATSPATPPASLTRYTAGPPTSGGSRPSACASFTSFGRASSSATAGAISTSRAWSRTGCGRAATARPLAPTAQDRGAQRSAVADRHLDRGPKVSRRSPSD